VAFVSRFAPSPTGRLHRGHAFSALTAWRAAREVGGRFLLRIEDIDPTRCKPEFEAAILEDLAWLGLEWPASPLNLSVVLAGLAAAGVYLFLWRTRAGYHVRAVGSSASAAEYAGIRTRRQVMLAMAVSGGLAGLVGMNEIAGVHGKLLLEFVSGAGFTGIAVALMGRNHPVGIVLASVLFGALFQGGAEVAFEVRGFSRDMVVMLQGFIVLFSGAMVYVIAPMLAWVLAPRSGAAHG